jgi:uncharacterized protein (TIGR04255 family)
MTDAVVYPKAPITEALLDIRVTPRASAPELLDELAKVVKSLRDEYPEVTEQMIGAASVTLGADAPPQASAQQLRNGFVAFSPDRKRAVQARVDGFSASKLAPYIDWNDLRCEARRLWNQYRKAANPIMVTRVALRYINRIDIPLPISDLKDYLRTAPEISPELPQEMTNFFMQLHLPQSDLHLMCILNSAMLPPTSPGMVSILFDIDLFRTSSVPQNEQEIWELLDQMRVRKNKIFEGSITEQARELFR